VFDPLARSQTTLIRWRFTGATRPFAVMVPVPEGATLKVGQKAPFNAFQKRLHPVGRMRRDIQLDFRSWLGSCLVPEVGDVETARRLIKKKDLFLNARRVVEDPTSHTWFLRNAMTISPTQVSWLRGVKDLGQRVVAVRLTPPDDGREEDTFTSPIVAITHRSTEPIYPAYIPKFSMNETAGAEVPLEIAVLTEWPVQVSGYDDKSPFLSVPISEKDLSRIAKSARGLDWSFRRDGILTAYQIRRRGADREMVFIQSDVVRTVAPKPSARVRPVLIPIPIEAIALVLGITFWGWLGNRRRGRRRGGIR
jgi:hypothetical protein